MNTHNETAPSSQMRASQHAPSLPRKLHHSASATPDAARVADFYQRIMGMEMVHTVLDDRVPSTGQAFPYIHLFFRMADGSTVAFFESPCLPPRAPSAHPGYDVFDHFAMQVNSREDVDEWLAWLVKHGVDVVGPTNHGIIYSIYFHDPDGRRLEITTDLDPTWSSQSTQASIDLAAWQATKDAAVEAGADPTEALIGLIRSRKHHT